MDLHPGHALRDGRGLVVREPERGRPDQDQLAGEAGGRHAALQHLCRRHEAPGAVPAEGDPHRAVLLGGNHEVADLDRLHPARARAHGEDRTPARHAQHLDAEPRDQVRAHRGHQRQPPEHTSLGVGAHQPVARRGGGDLVDVRECRVETPDGRDGVRSVQEDGGAAQGRGAGRGRLVEPDHAEDDGAVADGAREGGVLALEGAESRGEVVVDASEQGGHAIRRRHDHVEADGGRVARGDEVDDARQARARPRPLAVPGEACLIDRDDDDGLGRAHPGRHGLVGVERDQAQGALEWRRRREGDQGGAEHGETEGSPAPPAEDARPRAIDPVRPLALPGGPGECRRWGPGRGPAPLSLSPGSPGVCAKQAAAASRRIVRRPRRRPAGVGTRPTRGGAPGRG